MDQLIKIEDNKDLGQAVSARELYQFLGYKNNNWKRWYQKNIINNDFSIENEDYIEFILKSSSNNKSMTKEFVLSIDFAKRLSMMARTEQGEVARNYFLECERLAKNNLAGLSKYEILKMALESEERLMLLQNEVQVQAPKVRYFNQVLDSTKSYAISLIAKELKMSAIRLNKLLSELKVQYKVDGTWVLYSKYQKEDYTDTKTYTYTDSEGRKKTSMQTTWTEKGRFFIHEIVNASNVDKLISKTIG